MIRRCTNPKNDNFKDYGGRGITVCERWMIFEHFLDDMGERPEVKTLDRYPDHDGNYEPGNVRWATPKEQQRNQRTNRIVTFRGVTGCLAEICERFGMRYQTAYKRLRRGLSVDETFAP
jgi:hypothetical protein